MFSKSIRSNVNSPAKHLETNLERENGDVNQAEESKHVTNDVTDDDLNDI